MENKLVNHDFFKILKHLKEQEIIGTIIYKKDSRNTIIVSKILDFKIIDGIKYICLENKLIIKIADMRSFDDIIHQQ